MRNDNLCHEFISGICTRSTFASKITEKCRKLHDSGKKSVYDMNRLHDRDHDVFKIYSEILNEIGQKIENNRRIVQLSTKYSIIGEVKRRNSKTDLSDDFKNELQRRKGPNYERGYDSGKYDSGYFDSGNYDSGYRDSGYNQRNAQSFYQDRSFDSNETTARFDSKPLNTEVSFSISESRDLLAFLPDDFTSLLKRNPEHEEVLLFHRYYSKVVSVIDSLKTVPTLAVCEVCSHVYEQSCDHPHHNGYKQLRGVWAELKDKLKRNRVIN